MGQNLCVGHQQLAVDATAGGVSLTVPRGASTATIQILTADVWLTLNATTPSTTNGLSITAASAPFTINTPLQQVRLIRQAGTSASANIVYFRDSTET